MDVRYRTYLVDNARWEGFAFRDGDIVISTPPKCGTTWTQMLCALLIFQRSDFPYRLSDISPWLEMQTNSRDDVFTLLAAQTHRRFIKSHTPWDGLPHSDRVTYVCVARDPREVALSWANHMDNMDFGALLTARVNAAGTGEGEDWGPIPGPPPEDPVERFWEWVDSEMPASDAIGTLNGTLYHLETFWRERSRPNVALFHYSDLRTDLLSETRRLASELNIEVEESTLTELVEAASFSRMKADADRYAPDVNNGIWKDNAQFFDSGGFRDWRSIVGTGGARYDARVAALTGDPEFVAWVHH